MLPRKPSCDCFGKTIAANNMFQQVKLLLWRDAVLSVPLLVTAAICWWPRFSIHTKVFSVYLATNFIWQLPATTHQLLWVKTLTVTDRFRSNCEQLPTTTHQSTVLQAHIRPNRMCSFILKLIFDFIQPHNFDFWHEVMSLMLARLNAMFLLTALKH